MYLCYSAETFRDDHLGCYGKKWIKKTPYLDQLAEEGVVFENVYAEGFSLMGSGKSGQGERQRGLRADEKRWELKKLRV